MQDEEDEDELVELFCEQGDYVDLEETPLIPTIDRLPDVVDYSTRGPNDFMLSGPLGAGRGTGRKFGSVGSAYKWAVEKYGVKRVQMVEQESEYRWALLIKA
jgi:hypothetical protein